MKKGALVYDREGAERNGWFIRELTAAARRAGAVLETVIAESADGLPHCDFDFAIVRTRDPQINEYFRSRGVRAFNNTETNATANDKLKTYELCRALDIEVLPTERADVFLSSPDFGFPAVVKTRNGHGGRGVFRAEDIGDVRRTATKPNDYIVQPMCSECGVDVRLYVLGGRIVAAAERSSDSDFRSNRSLGGRARIVSPCREMEEAVGRIYSALRCDWIGVDFLPDRNGWVLNEIEDPVGARMLYELTDVDVARLLTEYCLSEIG